MKKYILSFFVIITFIVYALYQKLSGTSQTTSLATVSAAHNPVSTGKYKDGQYIGASENAYYGNVQVQVTISNGAISAVQFLDYPQDRGTSLRISEESMPVLQQEAIVAQSANVNTVSGATDTSGAFRQSLSSALVQAVNS